MDKKRYEELKAFDIGKALNTMRSMVGFGDAVYAAAYVLLVAGKNKGITLESVKDFLDSIKVDDARSLFINNTLAHVWSEVRSHRVEFSRDELEAIILFYEPSGTKIDADQTPAGVISLARILMDIRPGDKVADFGTGRSSFIRDAFVEEPNAHYYGNDLNPTVKEIAAIRAEILGGDITIEQGNILDMDDNHRRFDVAFSNYPLGLHGRTQLKKTGAKFDAVWKRPEFEKAASLDWAFNASVYGSISGPRRAVCIMTNGSTWNTLDKGARKWFLSRGSIEAVIALPDRIFENTNIGTTMIVFSHGHSDVMMVDARNMCEKGRRLNIITKSHVEEIVRCCNEESEFSKRVGFEELAANDYVLNPVRYMGKEVKVENGVPFETVIESITRGAQLKADELDGLVSETETDIQYLMLSNIQDGIISEDLPYLTMLDAKQEKYCLKSNDLILSKNGAPFKIAVAEVPAGKKILANGNLYVITLDTKKVDPYYIKAFLESDAGAAALSNIVVGAVIPSIGVEQLKKLIVPCAPLEEQHAVAEKYCAAIDEIKLLRRRMDKAVSNLKHMFDAKG